MKTFTKTMSMILIAVMCLSLFATSAYATDFSLDDNDAGSGFSVGVDAGPSFSADDGGFSLTAGDDADFTIGSSVAQVSEPVQQPQSQEDDSFSIDSSAAAQSQQPADEDEKKPETDSDEFSLDETAAFNGLYTTTMTFTQDKTSIKVSDTDANATVTFTAANFDGDTFPEGLYYSTNGSGEGKTALPKSAYQIVAPNLIILGSWLKSQPLGTYYFFGVYSLSRPVVQIGFITVNTSDPGAYGTFTVAPDSYTKYADPEPALIQISVTGGTFSPFTSYGAIPQGSTKGYTCNDYTLNTAKTILTLGKKFLLGLPDGNYDFYAKTATENVKLGSFTIKSGNGGNPVGVWSLWPDYSIPWTSGDDPLMFRSNLMAMRQTYPRYTIVPRYGYGAGSIPNNMIDVNQFWDMGDGVFALGTNFLRSLPAGTYTLQVVDYKHLEDCTNVVTFVIGSTLRPIDTDKHVIGSIKNLRFLCDEPVYEVYVGNIPLTYGEDYALSNGGKTVTLSFEFLNKRSPGNTYTIKVLTASGTYPSCTFQILSNAQGSASPRTGDESNLGLWAAFLLLSGTAVVVLVPKLRKHDF